MTIKIRLHNNDDTDYCDYEGETVEHIREQAKGRLLLATWNNGWSERLKNG